MLHIIGFLWILFNSAVLQAVSVVYNLRIAETTKRQAQQALQDKPIILAGTLFDQTRAQRCTEVQQNIIGALGTFIYEQQSFFFRVDTALGHIKEKSPLFYYSNPQTDDILFSGGFNVLRSDHARITISGMVGIPTHRDTSFEHMQLGTGHFGCGVQVDGSFAYIAAHPAHRFMTAVRLVHFFPRWVSVPAPLHPTCTPVRFDVGNVADLLFAHQSSWHNNRIEFGYNPTIGFSAQLIPTITFISNHLQLVRSSFYIGYQRQFKLHDIYSALTTGISYGFDHKPAFIGNKYIISIWASWGINF